VEVADVAIERQPGVVVVAGGRNDGGRNIDGRASAGRWRCIRRVSDELPQLITVLRGEMSLVGPRPPLRAEVATYTETVHQRMLVKPGITGL
jgi:hypothetical protein